jgi:uncharacterized protein YceK
MKKLICLVLALLTALSFAGCSSCSSSVASPDGSYWLKTPTTMTVSHLEERATYSVTVTKFKDGEITPEISGTYTTYLTTCTLPDDTNIYYCLETSLNLSGTYTYEDTTYPVNDSVNSVVVFMGADKKLKPVKSIKSMVSTSPILDDSGDIAFDTFDFSYQVDYSGKHAKVTYTDNTEDKNAEFPASKTFKNYYSSTFCENELLTMYPRMFDRSSSFDLSLKTLNAANQKMETIKVSTASYENEIEATENIWGKPNFKIDCLQFYKSGTYKGIAINAYYANEEEALAKQVLVKMETGIANVGTMTYTLTSFSTDQN